MTGKDDVSLIGPVSAGERILSLDVLRGFALLGILAVNMQLFAMIFAARSDRWYCGVACKCMYSYLPLSLLITLL